jgi:heme-degrading monooxygenase HmoA
MGNLAMADSETHIVTVFRNRLRNGVDGEYGALAPHIMNLARSMEGFVDAKTFGSPDGERVTIVTFASRDHHNAWRDHPEHRAAQQRGIDEFYETYSIQVAEVTHAHSHGRTR